MTSVSTDSHERCYEPCTSLKLRPEDGGVEVGESFTYFLVMSDLGLCRRTEWVLGNDPIPEETMSPVVYLPPLLANRETSGSPLKISGITCMDRIS